MKLRVIADNKGNIQAFEKIDVMPSTPRFEIRPHDSGHALHEIVVPPEIEDFFNTRIQELRRSLKIEVVEGQSRLRKVT